MSKSNNDVQRRYCSSQTVQIRDEATEAKVIRGYASVFYNPENPGTEFRLFDNYFERIAPGAFDRALQENQDVRGLFNHDSNMILGRNSAGTMRIGVDDVGLWYEIKLPNTRTGEDIYESIKRGDITGSSFAMRIKKETPIEEEIAGMKKRIFVVEDVDLFDVGPVAFPAYPATEAGVRSLGDDRVKDFEKRVQATASTGPPADEIPADAQADIDQLELMVLTTA